MKPRRLLQAYALANVVLYSMLLPLWEGFDEPFHFGYIQSPSNGRGLPDPRTSRLSQEVVTSLLLTPASLSVKRNLPEVTSYQEFFEWPESKREQVHQQLSHIDPGLRWRPSEFVDYEALQAPLAYAILALPERVLAKLPLPWRVLALRIVSGTLGAILLVFGVECLAQQLCISDPHKDIAVFCALSSQMIWATLAHVANDWLAVPLSVLLLVTVIHYYARPGLRPAALASLVLAAGLLTKAYFLAFLPVLASVCVFRRRWRDLAVAFAIILGLAGPWYMRNVERYGTISGMMQLREGAQPTAALHALRIDRLPAAIDSYAREALWTANNTFRSFSISTLRAVIVVWFAALLLWAATRHRSAEWIVLLHCGVFILALAYDTAIDYVFSHGEATGPQAWYTQVLLVPMLALALLGTTRWRRAGKITAVAAMILFGYILQATYLVKLIPLYSGFEGRTYLASVMLLYEKGLPTLMARLNEVCLAPAAIILSLSGMVSILALGQQIMLARLLFVRHAPGGLVEAATVPKDC